MTPYRDRMNAGEYTPAADEKPKAETESKPAPKKKPHKVFEPARRPSK